MMLSTISFVQNLHQEVKMPNSREDLIVLQRKLRFEEEEI
jgi:hypothetical protein